MIRDGRAIQEVHLHCIECKSTVVMCVNHVCLDDDDSKDLNLTVCHPLEIEL